MRLSLERFRCRRLRLSLNGGHASVPLWSGAHRPAGVEEHGQTGIGVPQELGSSCRLHGSFPGRGHRVTNPRPDARQSAASGETNQADCSCGTAKRRQRSAAGWAAGCRSALIVLTKQGNERPRGPCGGKRGIGTWTRCWEICRMPGNSESIFTLAATDSRAGETIATDGIHLPGLSDGH